MAIQRPFNKDSATSAGHSLSITGATKLKGTPTWRRLPIHAMGLKLPKHLRDEPKAPKKYTKKDKEMPAWWFAYSDEPGRAIRFNLDG